MLVFISCQVFRVIEPVWLHVTTGYWGSATYIGTGFSDRLAGSPYDDVNPNGLAFIIVFILPLMHFATKNAGLRWKVLYYLLMPLFIYAMILTQSRSGLIGLIVVTLGILRSIKWKIPVLIAITLCAVVIWGSLDQVHKERYLSINIFNRNVIGHESAEGRIQGWKWGFEVFLDRPLFGHGLGTSAEAGWNIAGHGQIAHNMYIEILQELGIIGFGVFVLFVKRLFESLIAIKKVSCESPGSKFFTNLISAFEIQGILLIVFSFASYGLSTYIWYLLSGCSAALLKLYGESRRPIMRRNYAAQHH
ncbi:MAG: hypothetical protein DRH50_15415 [Deltaproteobacteria bacterium]|nr:MAG: hypothetical protein DRH50_15415 [Deltaproteobacteria bacterium]